MGKIIEGLWDCPFCGNKRIRAVQKTCPDSIVGIRRTKIQNSICRMKLNMFLRRKQKRSAVIRTGSAAFAAVLTAMI